MPKINKMKLGYIRIWETFIFVFNSIFCLFFFLYENIKDVKKNFRNCVVTDPTSPQTKQTLTE